MRTWIWLAAALLAALWTAPAAAQDGRWWRAESAHFIIYGDRTERQVRQTAQMLEDFHAVLLAVTGAQQSIQIETKLEVYLLRGPADLEVVWPGAGDSVGGFYRAGGEQIAAFVRTDSVGGLADNSILLHEYAHHFMLHYFPTAYPRWYVEGFAEYVGATEFQGRRAHVGRPSSHRSDWLLHGGSFPIEHLLAPERVERRGGEFSAQFYANAWHATNFLFNRPERLRGFNAYVALLGEGADPIEGFEQGFGISIREFERELRAARGQRGARVTVFDLGPPIAEISTTRLARSSDDLVLPLARLRRGQEELSAEEAASLTRLGQRAPNDPLARLLLARVAISQSDLTAARSHVDAILAGDENHAEARYLLAWMILESAQEQSGQEAYATMLEARRELARGFRANPTHYPTLFLYASTFAGGSRPMTEDQLNVMARALELAPQSSTIRIVLSRELMRAGEFDAAIIALQPLLYAPHNPSGATQARAMLEAARRRGQPPTFVEASEEEGQSADD